MNRTAQNMRKLIEKRYYATAEQALEILDAFLMAARVSMEEYTELCLLVEGVYSPLVSEPVPEPVMEIPTVPLTKQV